MQKSEKQNNKNKLFFIQKYKKGFALLFSILLASFLISLGISIFSISMKEIQITTSIRDSQVAYYAADSAIDCITYWDVKNGAIPECISNNSSSCDMVSTTTYNQTLTCNGHPVVLFFIQNENPLIFSTGVASNFFMASTTSSSTPVADIKSIQTQWIPDSSVVRTTISVYGHNTGIIGRRVERGITQVFN
jgi:Tfp pilus assembly protein PilX